MKWTFFIKHKMAAAGLLGIVIALVILNNISEQKTSRELNETFSSLYEDRLMAESYILTMYSDLHKIDEVSEQLSGSSGNSQAILLPLVSNINKNVALYRETELTPNEQTEFNAFVLLVRDVNANITSGNIAACRTCVAESLDKLSALSEIQVAEGTRLNNNSQRLHSETTSTSQFELAMLIVIGVLIQALIFTTKTIQGTVKQQVGLN